MLVPKVSIQYIYSKQIKDCGLMFNNICNNQGCKLHALEIVDNHIHLFVEFIKITNGKLKRDSLLKRKDLLKREDLPAFGK